MTPEFQVTKELLPNGRRTHSPEDDCGLRPEICSHRHQGFPSLRSLATPRFLIPLSPPSSPRFSSSLQKTRKYCACWRTFLDLRAPEKLRFCRQQPIYGRFSLSRIEPVPFRPPRGIKVSETRLRDRPRLSLMRLSPLCRDSNARCRFESDGWFAAPLRAEGQRESENKYPLGGQDSKRCP